MRIAHLLSSMSRVNAGTTNAVRDLTIHQALRGDHEIAVFAAEDEYSADDLPVWGDTPVYVAGTSGFGKGGDLRAQLLAYQPDVIHRHGVWAQGTQASAAVAKETGARQVASPHGAFNEVLSGKAGKRTAGLFKDRGSREGGIFHALSIDEARAIRAAGYDNTICVIAEGVAEPPAHTKNRDAPWVQIRQGEKTLLFMGRLQKENSVEALIDGWARYVHTTDASQPWRLQIVGWSQDNYAPSLRQRAIDNKLGYTVNFAGPMFGDKRWVALHHADAFVLPAVAEIQPQAVLEAWACALPVMITPECGLTEGFQAGAAFPVAPSPESIAEAITRVTAMSDEERLAMGQRARDLSLKNHSWIKTAAELSELYDWVCRRGPQPLNVLDEHDLEWQAFAASAQHHAA